DLGRWRNDGLVEFRGRKDRQVKLSGYRIELGEIEAQLLQHERVKDAVVLAREDVPGQKRLVAYVVGNREIPRDTPANEDTNLLRGQVVTDWNALYEQTYGGPHEVYEPTFVGWNSSYTGRPIPESQMQEWLSDTLDRIRSLKPRRILEIGCGVG